MKISDRALKDFWKEKMTGWFVEEENVILRRYHNWIFNEMVECPHRNAIIKEIFEDFEAEICSICGMLWSDCKDGKVKQLERYKTYEEEC